MNAISCITRVTANRVIHFVATGSGLTIASLFFLAPAASAAPFQICDLEQGPNGPQCVQGPKQAELCELDKDLNCVKPPKQIDLCELEQGPDGLQCAGNELDEKAPAPEPQPPADPEPVPDEAPKPEVASGFEAPAPKVDAPGSVDVAPDEAGIPELEIAASPAAPEAQSPSNAVWIGSLLLASGLILLLVRRRRTAQDDAVASLEKM